MTSDACESKRPTPLIFCWVTWTSFEGRDLLLSGCVMLSDILASLGGSVEK